MKLKQTLEKPVNGYWDGGKKQVFEWEIDNFGGGSDSKGSFVRIGSFSANHWFNVAEGKTEKLTLSYAKKHLIANTKDQSVFEYIA